MGSDFWFAPQVTLYDQALKLRNPNTLYGRVLVGFRFVVEYNALTFGQRKFESGFFAPVLEVDNGYGNVEVSYIIYIKTTELKKKEDAKQRNRLEKKVTKLFNCSKENIKVLNSPLVTEDIENLAPMLDPNMKFTNNHQMKYYDYLLKYIEDNLNST
ncbi:uncharacterized protein LOC112592048 [Melanaphis sacchari]|uniref:uncharacterized protein LOC112592048 n=1 Tax=Melanaphis sacchari TaxID=742174 RepID=UPI000DC131E8|nr:uncharacterized protein LOC112592048 [Melanaphis sacchari]